MKRWVFAVGLIIIVTFGFLTFFYTKGYQKNIELPPEGEQDIDEGKNLSDIEVKKNITEKSLDNTSNKTNDKKGGSGGGGGGFDSSDDDPGTEPSGNEPEDYGPSLLFSDNSLKENTYLPSELNQYIETIDQIKAKAYEDFFVREKPCNPCTRQFTYQGQSFDLDVYEGSFVPGVHVAPRAEAAIDYIGSSFSYFDYTPNPLLKGNFDYLLQNVIPVNIHEQYEIVIPSNVDWSKGVMFLAVTQHSVDVGYNVDNPIVNIIAVKYGVPVVHVSDVLSEQENTCANTAFCNSGETLGYKGGNFLIRITPVLLKELDQNGVSLLSDQNKIFQRFYGFVPYVQAYSGSITFGQRFLEQIAPVGTTFTKVVTHGGSKDGGAVLYTADVDDRIVAFAASGYDVLDAGSEDSVLDEMINVWGETGEDENFVHIPGLKPDFVEWSKSPGGLKTSEYWDLSLIIPQYAPELFTVFSYSTHDLHYPISSNLDFWWNKDSFKNQFRQLVYVNHDHGGTYDTADYEPQLSDLRAHDYLLRKVLYNKMPVDVSIQEPSVDNGVVSITGTVSSVGVVEGASVFIAESSDYDFSLATGIEVPSWSVAFPFELLGGSGKTTPQIIGIEGSSYGGFAWVYVKTDGAGRPVDSIGRVISDPWEINNNDVVYLTPFNSLIPSDSGLFTRRRILDSEVTSGAFGVDSQVSFEVKIPYASTKKYVVFANAWDSQNGFNSFDFSSKWMPPSKELFEELPDQKSWEDFKASSTRGSAVDATIYRDIYGVPHIYSESDEAAFFALGYAQAEDGVEKIFEKVFQPQGRLPEFFGENKLVEAKLLKRMNFKERAIAYQDETSISTWKIAKAFADGVNTFVEENKARVPAWVVNAGLIDEYDIVAYANWLSLFSAFYDATSEAVPATPLSNVWAIAPKKTVDGVPVLVNDPHVPFDWILDHYEAHVETPNYHIAGSSNFGLPGITVGTNGEIAWGMTANEPDLSDLYIETIQDNRYLYDGKWYLLKKEPMIIKVMGQSDYEFTSEYTHHGPISFDEAGKLLSLKLAGLDSVHSALDYGLELSRASTLQEFKSAFARRQTIDRNIIYADKAGNIFYVYNALQPVKDESLDWEIPIDGSVSSTEWGKYFSFQELPQIENPASGWLANTNNAPAFVTQPFYTIDSNLPSYTGSHGDNEGLRGRRLVNLITTKTLLDSNDVESYSFDYYIQMAEYVVPPLVDALNQHSTSDPDFLKARSILADWNYYATKDSSGMSLFWSWYTDTKPIGYLPDAPITFTDDEKEDAVKQFIAVVDYFKKTYGSVEVPWEEIHVLALDPTIGLPGGDTKQTFGELTSLFLTNTDLIDKTTGVGFVKSGSAHLRIITLGNKIKFQTMKVTGQSTDPNSPHYNDLTSLYGQQQLKELYFYKDDVLNNLESTKIMSYFPLQDSLAAAPSRPALSRERNFLILIIAALLILFFALFLKYKRSVVKSKKQKHRQAKISIFPYLK